MIVDKLGYTLVFPTEVSGRFEGYDFALRRIAQQPLSSGNRLVCEPRELFMAVLTMAGRGKPMATPPITLPIATGPQPPAAAALADSTAKQLPAPRKPVPGLAWGVDVQTARRVLRESLMIAGGIARPETGEAQNSITVSDVPWLWNSPADLLLSFRNGRLQAIRATVKRPPSLIEAVADYEKQLGPPLEKQFARQEEVSRIRWHVKQGADLLEIIIAEAQGTMTISYEVTGLSEVGSRQRPR